MQWITYLCNQTGRRSVQHRANAGENLSRMMLTIMTIISDPVLQLQQGRPPVLLLQALNSLSLRSCSVRTLGGGRHVSHLLCWAREGASCPAPPVCWPSVWLLAVAPLQQRWIFSERPKSDEASIFRNKRLGGTDHPMWGEGPLSSQNRHLKVHHPTNGMVT